MIVVGTTLAPYKLDGEEELRWLRNAEAMQAAGPEQVTFFCALEHHSDVAPVELDRARASSEPLLNRLDDVGGEFWRFSIDDDYNAITGMSRLVRICTGRNLVTEYAIRRSDVSHILFLDSDVIAPGDAIPKLLELNYPIVGGDVPSYCLTGAKANGWPFPVEVHWNTAGFLLVARKLFTKLRWYHDLDDGISDDPTYARDAVRLGYQTLVRKDVVGDHPSLAPVDQRGHDLRLA